MRPGGEGKLVHVERLAAADVFALLFNACIKIIDDGFDVCVHVRLR